MLNSLSVVVPACPCFQPRYNHMFSDHLDPLSLPLGKEMLAFRMILNVALSLSLSLVRPHSSGTQAGMPGLSVLSRSQRALRAYACLRRSDSPPLPTVCWAERDTADKIYLLSQHNASCSPIQWTFASSSYFSWAANQKTHRATSPSQLNILIHVCICFEIETHPHNSDPRPWWHGPWWHAHGRWWFWHPEVWLWMDRSLWCGSAL